MGKFQSKCSLNSGPQFVTGQWHRDKLEADNLCGQLATVCGLISQRINQQKELSPECFDLAFNCQLQCTRNYTLDFILNPLSPRVPSLPAISLL